MNKKFFKSLSVDVFHKVFELLPILLLFSPQGINQDVFWNPDSSMLAIVTEGGYMILLDIFEVEKEYLYFLEPINPRHQVQQLHPSGLLKIELSHRLTVTLKGKITSVSPRIEELFITTTEGWVHRLTWAGEKLHTLLDPLLKSYVTSSVRQSVRP